MRRKHTLGYNIYRLVHSRALLRGGIATAGLLLLEWQMTDFALIRGNLGIYFLIAEMTLHILLSLLFGLFVALQWYKWKYFSSFDTKKSVKGGVAGMFGLMAAGCPACSVTIVSFIGLGSLFTVLPGHGLELKAVGIILLVRVNYVMLRDLLLCKK